MKLPDYGHIVHSRKLTWKPKKGPTKTTVLQKGDYMGFHVSLGECKYHEFLIIVTLFRFLNSNPVERPLLQGKKAPFWGIYFRHF